MLPPPPAKSAPPPAPVVEATPSGDDGDKPKPAKKPPAPAKPPADEDGKHAAATTVQKVQRGRYHREVAGAMKVMEAAEEEAGRAAPLAERLAGRHRRASAPEVVALGGGAAAAAAALRAARPRRHSWSAVKGSVAKARAAQALTESAKAAAWARAGRLAQLGWAAAARVRAAVAWALAKAGVGGATSSRVECSICVTRPCSALQALLDGTGGGTLPSDTTLAFDACVA